MRLYDYIAEHRSASCCIHRLRFTTYTLYLLLHLLTHSLSMHAWIPWQVTFFFLPERYGRMQPSVPVCADAIVPYVLFLRSSVAVRATALDCLVSPHQLTTRPIHKKLLYLMYINRPRGRY
jgi:hypothetical protein